ARRRLERGVIRRRRPDRDVAAARRRLFLAEWPGVRRGRRREREGGEGERDAEEPPARVLSEGRELHDQHTTTSWKARSTNALASVLVVANTASALPERSVTPVIAPPAPPAP